jgi:hypothetical protein
MGLRSSDEAGWELGHAEAGHDATVKRCRELGAEITEILNTMNTRTPCYARLRAIAAELEKMR